jgi:DNA polymerase-3 subunit delta'
MALRAQRRGPRVALIRDADALTTDAQNAMLRLLEEPPGTSIIVLVAANPSSLLATVRSRCQIVRFGVLSNAEIVELVTAAGKPAAIAEQAAAVAHGRGARALAYGPEALAERATLIGEFEALRGDRHADIEALVSKMADKKNPRDEWLEMLFEWQMTKIKASVGYQVSETDPGLRDLLDSVDGRQTRRLIDEACRINATRRAVAAQANVKLAMRELLLDIRD